MTYLINLYLRSIHLKFIYFIGCLLLSSNLLAMIEGSCEDERLLPQGEVLKEMSFFVLNDQTPFYYQKKGNIKHKAKFGKTIFVEKKEQNWLKTEENDWVHAKDVLCGGEVLRDPKTQLDLKVFPKFETYKKGSTQTVFRAYLTLDAVKKVYGTTYLKHYYVLAKNDDCTRNNTDKSSCTYYLLSEIASLDNGKDDEGKLVGWVAKKQVISWNTTIAIRPDDNPNTQIKFYYKPYDNKYIGLIRGGKQWYQKLMHLPVLEKSDGFYHVLIPYQKEVYIPVSDKIIEEAWMTYEQLQNWISVLKPITSEYKKGQRKEMVRKIKQALNLITGSPKNIIQKGETIAHFIKRVGRGLPLREKSPFTQYTMEEIMGMKKCFPQLKTWVRSHLMMLQNVLNNPIVETTFRTGKVCIDNYGKQIPKITITGAERLGDDNSYSYQHQFIDNQTFYWVPMKYLP